MVPLGRRVLIFCVYPVANSIISLCGFRVGKKPLGGKAGTASSSTTPASFKLHSRTGRTSEPVSRGQFVQVQDSDEHSVGDESTRGILPPKGQFSTHVFTGTQSGISSKGLPIQGIHVRRDLVIEQRD